MPTFKPAYLIHGDDHGRIAERRARLRALAESESGAQGVELLENEAASPEAVARALNAMTFAVGRRFIIVEGAERWKEKEIEPLEAALAQVAPDTTVAFFAREDSRAKAPTRLHEAVRRAGGDISAEESVKSWELPKWVAARAGELGIKLAPDAARVLVQQVGERQQRLLRELEKLALWVGDRAAVDAADVEELAAPSAESRAWSLADLLVEGDAPAATRSYLVLREQGERLPGLIYWMAQRVRLAHEVATALDAGEPAAQIKRRLRMPSRAADRLIAGARRAGADRLREAIARIADLELASRGGAAGSRRGHRCSDGDPGDRRGASGRRRLKHVQHDRHRDQHDEQHCERDSALNPAGLGLGRRHQRCRRDRRPGGALQRPGALGHQLVAFHRQPVPLAHGTIALEAQPVTLGEGGVTLGDRRVALGDDPLCRAPRRVCRRDGIPKLGLQLRHPFEPTRLLLALRRGRA